MGALERGECQRHALDNKQTCFGISFDGKAAFPSVDRDIQIRELYSSGESGKLLQYSRNTLSSKVGCWVESSGSVKDPDKATREHQDILRAM